MMEYQTFEEEFRDAEKLSFDMFSFNDVVGRDKTLPLLAAHMFMFHHLDVYINERKFANFLH